MVISSDSRMGKHRDDDHQDDEPYFIRFNRFFYKQNQADEL